MLKNVRIVSLLLCSVIVLGPAYGQSLEREFAHSLFNVRVLKSIQLNNNDIVILGTAGAETDVDPQLYSYVNYDYLNLGDQFLGCYSPEGNLKWYAPIKRSGYINNQNLAHDALDNVYYGATFDASIEFNTPGTPLMLNSNGNFDVCVAKYGADGTFKFAFNLGGTGDDYFSGIAVSSNGQTAVVGQFTGTVDFDPGVGIANLTTLGLADVFLAAYDSSGNYIRSGSITQGASYTNVTGISADLNNQYYAYGFFNGTLDFDPGPGVQNVSSVGSSSGYLIKLTDTFTPIWCRLLSGASTQTIDNVTFDNAGNLLVRGSHLTATNFNPGGTPVNLVEKGKFVCRYDTAFGYLGVLGISSPNNYFVDITSVATDASNNIVIAGIFSDAVDFNPGPGAVEYENASSSHYDAFVAFYDANYQFVKGNHFFDTPLADEEIKFIHVESGNKIWLIGTFDYRLDIDLGPSVLYLKEDEAPLTALVSKYYLCAPVHNTLNPVICSGQQFTAGNEILTAAGTYRIVVPAASGCDSIITVNLTVNYPDNGVYLEDSVFYSTAMTGQYQWYNCNTQSIVPGATGSSFVPTDTSEYAVIVTQNGCTSTSVCIFSAETINVAAPVLDWAYPWDVANSNAYGHLNSNLNAELAVAGLMEDPGALDFQNNTHVIRPHHNVDLVVGYYGADGSFRAGLTAGYDSVAFSTTPESANFIRFNKQNQAMVVGHYQFGFDLDPDTGIVQLPMPANSALTGVWMAQLNGAAQINWAKGLTGRISVLGMQVRDDGGMVTCGAFYTGDDFDPDAATYTLPTSSQNASNAYVANYSATGQFLNAFSIYNNDFSGLVEIRAMALDKTGNTLIVGDFYGTTDFDPGPAVFNLNNSSVNNSFLAKYSPTGQFIWAKAIHEGVQDLACNSTNQIFVAYNRAPYLEWFNAAGTYQGYLATFNPSFNCAVKRIEIDNTNELTLTAMYDQNLTVNGVSYPPGYRAFIGRFDKNLVCKWGFTLNAEVTGLHVDREKNIYITGQFINFSSFDADPGPGTTTVSPNGHPAFIARYGNHCVYTQITGNTLMCQGATTTLDAGPGFVSYLWSTGSTSQTINVTQGGSYSCQVTNSLGCAYTDSVLVTVHPQPVVNIGATGSVNMCLGDSVLLTATPGLASYAWHLNSSLNPVSANPSFYAFNSGNYTCVVTDMNGCTNTSNTLRVRIICLPPLPNQNRDESPLPEPELPFQVYPNPTTGNAYVASGCADGDRVRIQVFDASQREVFAKLYHQGNLEMELPKLAPGAYFVKVICADGEKTAKLIQLE